MKKLFIGLLFLVMLVNVSYAVEEVTSTSAGPFTLMSTVSTGAGSEIDVGNTYCMWSCTATWGGTAPTSITLGIALASVSGSYDSTGVEDTKTITASPTRFYTVNKCGRYIKGNYISKVGGDGTTSLTLSCIAGGHF